MKKFYFLVFSLMAILAAWSQTTYNWQGANGASWAVPTNWSSVPAGNPRFTPAATDRLVFNTGTTLSITAVPTQTVGRFTVTSGAITLVPSVAGNTLTIGNTSAPAFVVTGNLTSGLNITLNNNVDAVIAGTFTINGGLVYNTDGTANPRPSTTVTATGVIHASGAVVCTSSSRLIINDG